MLRITSLGLTIMLLLGCQRQPPVITIKRKLHPPLAYVRLLNLDRISYTLQSKDRALSGSVRPGSGSAFNYLASNYGPPFAVDSSGKMRKLGETLRPAQVTTYVLLPDRVTLLNDEPHQPRSTKFATVCFRSLGKASKMTLVDKTGKRSVLTSTQILVLDPGAYKVEALTGEWPEQTLSFVSNMTFTILDIGPNQPLKVLRNSPNQVFFAAP